MAPEQEARQRAHESDEPRRRRRPAADWGVGEDIFDRMPSRRFRRGRAEHQEIVIRRADAGGEPEVAHYAGENYVEPARQVAADWDEAPRRGAAGTRLRVRGSARAGVPPRLGRGSAPGCRRVRRRGSAPHGRCRTDDEPRRPAGNPAPRRRVESWLDDEDRPLVRGESRTIVLSRDPEPEYVVEAPYAMEMPPEGRRTIRSAATPTACPPSAPHGRSARPSTVSP